MPQNNVFCSLTEPSVDFFHLIVSCFNATRCATPYNTFNFNTAPTGHYARWIDRPGSGSCAASQGWECSSLPTTPSQGLFTRCALQTPTDNVLRLSLSSSIASLTVRSSHGYQPILSSVACEVQDHHHRVVCRLLSNIQYKASPTKFKPL